MTDEFAPPAVPKSDNSTGPPVLPSGLHPSDPKPAVITNVGTDGVPPPPAASNIHGTPTGQGNAS
jgi:hypothetical protein